MTDIVIETLFPDKNNLIEIEMRADGVLIDFTSVTRYLLTMTYNRDESVIETVDTDINAGAITGDSVGVIVIDIGLLATSFQKGRYKTRLCIYDPSNVEGLVIIDSCSISHPKLNIDVC